MVTTSINSLSPTTREFLSSALNFHPFPSSHPPHIDNGKDIYLVVCDTIGGSFVSLFMSDISPGNNDFGCSIHWNDEARTAGSCRRHWIGYKSIRVYDICAATGTGTGTGFGLNQNQWTYCTKTWLLYTCYIWHVPSDWLMDTSPLPPSTSWYCSREKQQNSSGLVHQRLLLTKHHSVAGPELLWSDGRHGKAQARNSFYLLALLSSLTDLLTDNVQQPEAAWLLFLCLNPRTVPHRTASKKLFGRFAF